MGNIKVFGQGRALGIWGGAGGGGICFFSRHQRKICLSESLWSEMHSPVPTRLCLVSGFGLISDPVTMNRSLS